MWLSKLAGRQEDKSFVMGQSFYLQGGINPNGDET
jgi:hypothetical protein